MDDNTDSKICSRCQIAKELDQFSADRTKKDGKQGYCRSCKNDLSKARDSTRTEYFRTRKAEERIENHEHVLSRERAWRKTPAGKAKTRRQGIARRTKLGVEHATVYELKARWDEYRGMCAYCAFRAAIEWDHYIPLKHGGTDTIENLFPACQECNRGRGGKFAKLPIFDWMMVH
jgi:5-methylcytosine-specific restriction endonuclease McrA